MSMTHNSAVLSPCPIAKEDEPSFCLGTDCPRWVTERDTEGRILCTDRRLRFSGEGLAECLKAHEVEHCLDCGSSIGHCAG